MRVMWVILLLGTIVLAGCDDPNFANQVRGGMQGWQSVQPQQAAWGYPQQSYPTTRSCSRQGPNVVCNYW